MRSHLPHLKGALLLGGLGVLAWVPAQAAAQTRSQAAQVYAPIVNQLRQAQHLLHEANHDYDGHRVRAAKDIKQAIRALLPHAHAGTKKKPAVPAPPVHEGQALSDAQMQQAAQIVNNVLAQLTSVPANTRTAAAVPQLQQALVEIQRGLAWDQKHEQKAAQRAAAK
jgi:hypothetical protein